MVLEICFGFLVSIFRAWHLVGFASSALSFTTFYSLSGGVAVEHGLELGPATPKDKPTRLMIALAILMTAETRQGKEKIMDRQVMADFAVSPQAQHFHVVRCKDFGRETCFGIRVAAGVTQVEQRYRHYGHQCNRRFQASSSRELHVFDLTTRLFRFVIFLQNPTPLVPTGHPPRI